MTQSYIALIRFGLTDPFQADLTQALKSDGFDLRSVGAVNCHLLPIFRPTVGVIPPRTGHENNTAQPKTAKCLSSPSHFPSFFHRFTVECHFVA